ncbi:DUF2851 family protein [Odoribacter sp. OttesenSCG-928-L07]|nr:DUF2851 family protein [Odoribacter sp. OttesenSCG-928-L07]
MIDEKFLAFIWEQRLIGAFISTVDNVDIKVLSTGYRNNGQGPDFLNARLQIGDTLWSGSVEVHVKSSDWFVHCHQIDKNYSNVICHVVWKYDADVFYTQGNKIPTIDISKLVPPFLIENFKNIMESMEYIPCASLLNDVPEYIKYDMLETTYFEELNTKFENYTTSLKDLNNNFDELCYRMVVRSFGFKVNNEAFYETSKKLPFKILLKYSSYEDVVDALFFGQANLLHDTFQDDYPRYLYHEYKYYAKLHDLQAQKNVPWKMLRLRPANFPCIRLAQCAAIFKNGFHGLDTILVIRKLDEYHKMFCNPINEYWNEHVKFDVETKKQIRIMGNSSVDLILINTIIPLFNLLCQPMSGQDRTKNVMM